MPIHYDTIEDGQNKKSYLFSNCNANFMYIDTVNDTNGQVSVNDVESEKWFPMVGIFKIILSTDYEGLGYRYNHNLTAWITNLVSTGWLPMTNGTNNIID